MPITDVTIDWSTSVISVPKTATTLIDAGPPEIRELDVDAFRLQLKNLEDDAEGIPFTNTHIHNTEVTFGGITLSRVVEIIAPYTVTFENDNYAVNLVGANNNISDKTNLNNVSIRASNSAGLVTITSGSGLSQEEHDQLMKALTVAKFLGLK